MPVCKYVPEENRCVRDENKYWDKLDKTSQRLCKQGQICGDLIDYTSRGSQPAIPAGGKRKHRRGTKKARRNRRRSTRRN